MQPDIPDTDDDLFAFISADTSLPSASTESVVDEVDRYWANADVLHCFHDVVGAAPSLVKITATIVPKCLHLVTNLTCGDSRKMDW